MTRITKRIGRAYPDTFRGIQVSSRTRYDGKKTAPFKAAWYWVRAYVVTFVPGFGRFSVCDDDD